MDRPSGRFNPEPAKKFVEKTVRVKAKPAAEVNKEQLELFLSKEEQERARIDYLKLIEDLPEAEYVGASAVVVSPEYIRENSVTEITRSLKDVEDDNYGGTVMDPKMGVSITKICATCNFDRTNCLGHFGYITLHQMVLHAAYIKYVVAILNCVCRACSQLKLREEDLKEMGILKYQDVHRLFKMAQKLSKIGCPTEGCNNAIYDGNILGKKSERLGKIFIKQKEKETTIPVEAVYAILHKISLENYRLMGFPISMKNGKIIGTHPENYIIRLLFIRPPRDRPSLFVNGKLIENDLTKIYDRIVITNNRLVRNKADIARANKKESPKLQAQIDEDVKEMFKLTASLIDSEKFQSRIFGSRQFKGLRQIQGSKTGLQRGNMQGKRTNHVARSVLTPDPTLEYGEFTVPADVAENQTFPEEVNLTNIVALTSLLRNGGVKSLIPGSGKEKYMLVIINDENKNLMELRVGDTVYRKIMNGDPLVFNRNPTIHMYSVMGGTTVIRKQKTFSPHMAMTPAGQIDFDGDEANVHFVQKLSAAVDIEQIMAVWENIINVQNNKPLVGAVYDIPMGAWLLTKQNMVVNKSDFWNAVSFLRADEQVPTLFARAERHSLPLEVSTGIENGYNGRLLFSSILPADLYYSGYGVEIKDGILLSTGSIYGVVKQAIGNDHNSLVQIIWSQYGILRTKAFLTDLYFVINAVYTGIGITLSLQDAEILDPRVALEIEKKREELETKFDMLDIPPDADDVAKQKREKDITQITYDINTVTVKALEKIDPEENNLKAMAMSKAKGKEENLVSMVAQVGQQFVYGERFQPTLRGGQVCLPFFDPTDKSLQSRGYCDRSYKEGLTLDQYIFHSAASREQLVDTSITTRYIGADHRDLVKKMEDQKSRPDTSVEDKGILIQLTFGGHGFNPEQMQYLPSKYGKVPQPVDLDTIIGIANNLVKGKAL